jgi:integrase
MDSLSDLTDSKNSNPEDDGPDGFQVTVDGIKYRVFIPPDRSCYYVRFERRNKAFRRTLRTTVRAIATSRAKAIIRNILDGDKEADAASKFRSEYGTIGQLLDIYAKHGGPTRTPRENAAALRSVVSVKGGDPDKQRLTVLTGALVREWVRVRKDEISAHSLASNWVKAKCVLGRKFLPHYEDAGLKIPDLKSFLGAQVEQPDRRLPRALDEGVIRSIMAAAPELKREDPACYVAFLLFSRLGMRNVEIEAARWDWIERTERGAVMAIIERPEEGFSPKGNEGRVPISADTLAELKEFRALSTDGHIVPARHKSERAEIVDRRHSAWIGRWIKDRSKTSYELRRYAGSLILKLTNGDIMAVRDFLRHADVQTTQKWYAYRLRELPSISAADL